MITKIEVNGFKSLGNFELILEPGLNVLVGPNGVGKTNITLFFEFLSYLVTMPIGDAVREIGGAGSIFQKIGEEDYVPTISATIHGCAIARKRFLSYRYQFEIGISAAKDKVFFAHQEVRFRYVDKFVGGRAKKRGDGAWPLLVVQHADVEDKCGVEVVAFDRRIIKDRFPVFIPLKKREDFIDNIENFILLGDPTNNSLIDLFVPYIQFFYTVLFDFRDGETFNVIPSRVRELEDSATTPGIRRDGSGLAATLYAIRRGSYASQAGNRVGFDPTLRQRFHPRHWERILAHLKNANSSISTIDITNSPFDNKLIFKVIIESGSYNAVLPLSALSDGTIKWLALITAILTSKSIFSIEEPENFLHPWMQAEIANIMRGHLEEQNVPAFVLMTTHSESLLNFVRPEEVVLIGMVDGQTSARRLKRVKQVKEAISNSGFGLGFFYFSNALIDA